MQNLSPGIFKYDKGWKSAVPNMVLLGILASQLFAFKPLKDIKYVDFHKKQSSLLASAGTSTS